MQAYFALLRGKRSRARLLLEDCVVESNNIGAVFDEEWAKLSREAWFEEEEKTVMHFYDGLSKYRLPKPIG